MNTPLGNAIRTGVAAGLFALLVGGCGQSSDSLLKSARDYIAKGDSNSALIQLRNALQKAPNNAEARYLLGTLLTERRDPAGGVKELRKALELGYPEDTVLPALARAMIDDGDTKDLLSEFGNKTLANPDAQAALKSVIGRTLLDSGRPKEAEQAFAAALAAKPGFADASLGVATLRAREGNLAEAKKIVEDVLAHPPAPPEASMLQSQLFSAEGRSDAAQAVLEKLADTNPKYLPARYRLAAMFIARGELDRATAQVEAIRKVSKQDVRAYYFEAMVASTRGELSAARESLQQVLKASPKNLPALVLAGEVEFRSGQYLQAEDYMRQALRVAPGLPYAERVLASTYLRMGSPSRALDVIQAQLNRGNPDAQLMGLAGEAYLALGDLAKAGQYFAKVATLDPRNAAARTRLGQVRFAEGDTEGAIRDLEAASSLDANVSSADLALVTNLVRQKQYDEALAAVAKLEKKQPSNPLVYNLRGIVYVGKRDYSNARASFERALQVQSDYLPAIGNLAQLDRIDHKPDEARKRFQAILDKEPKNEQALLGYANLVQSLNGDPAEVESVLKKAVTANPQSLAARAALVGFYTKRGDFKQALLAAQDAYAAQPTEPRTLEMLGQVQLAAGEAALAIGTFSKLVAARPGSVEPLMLLAHAEIVAKDYDRAVEKMREALLINPDYYEANREIVGVYVMSGRHDQAMQEIKTLQRRRPNDSRVYVLEGDLLAIEQKKFPEAEAAYKNAQRLAPDDGTIAAKIHAAGVGAGKVGAADATADKWLRDHPKDTVLRTYLGDRALRTGDYKAAARHYQALIAQQPDNVVYLNNLAWASGEINDPKALSYAEKAASLAPDNGPILDTLGTLLIKKGDVAQGVEKIRQAVQFAPALADIRLHYAKGLIKLGDKEAARKELDALTRASAQAPDNAAAKAKDERAGSPGSGPTLVCDPACASEAAGLLKTL